MMWVQEANTVFAAIEHALKRREEQQLAARAKQQQQEAAQRATNGAQPRPALLPQAAKPPLAAPLGSAFGSAAAAAGPAAAGRSPEALSGGVDEDSGTAAAAVAADTPLVTSQLRDALVAEVSGLADNVQEVCSMIRADTAALAHPNGVLTDSPRKQANEVAPRRGFLSICTFSSLYADADMGYRIIFTRACFRWVDEICRT